MDASQLRKTQRHDDMPWIQPSHEVGDLPWLDPNFSNNNTPSFSRHSSIAQVHGHSSGSQIEDRSLPENNIGGQVAEQMGYTISEPTKYDISNFHSPGCINDILNLDPQPQVTPHPLETNSSVLHSCRTHSLPYITIATAEQNYDTQNDYSNSSPIQHTIQSPTKFFSAPDFSSEVSPSDANHDGGQPTQGSDGKMPIQSSSSMFIPRGLSSGPQLLARPGAQSSPIQTLFSQLSQASLSQQEDQAPDLEMDLYDIAIA